MAVVIVRVLRKCSPINLDVAIEWVVRFEPLQCSENETPPDNEWRLLEHLLCRFSVLGYEDDDYLVVQLVHWSWEVGRYPRYLVGMDADVP